MNHTKKYITEVPTEKSIYLWNIIGSMANAGMSLIVLMVVTRTLDKNNADIFSIAWAISQQMATIGMFQIRTYQATDVTERFKFKQYFLFRIITISFMMLFSVCYIVINRYSIYKSVVILLICLFRAVDALADVYEGWFQQKERLDLAGKALTVRVILGVFCFSLTLFIVGDLLVSSVVLLGAYIIGIFITDIRYILNIKTLKTTFTGVKGVSWIFKLTIEGLPLFVNAYLMMSIMNEPKMVIEQAIATGDLAVGGQTIYGILLMPASFLTLAYIVFRPMLTQMAIMWNDKKVDKFLKIIFKMGGALLAMACLILVGSAILGIPILSLVYAIELDGYKSHLLVIILGGCFCTFSYVLDNALIVIRRQYLLILSYVFTWLYVKLITEKMVTSFGLMGGALTYATSMIVFFCFTALLFIICFKMACKDVNE